MALVFGTFSADGIATTFANDFLVAKSKNVHETESTLAERALIFCIAFLGFSVEDGWKAEKVLG